MPAAAPGAVDATGTAPRDADLPSRAQYSAPARATANTSVVSGGADGAAGAGAGAPFADDALIRPLNARSLALSALLGTHPPRLPTRSLVALGELFAIAAGTMRTALSRLATAGDAESGDGWYSLAGPLVDRQRSQDAGRDPAPLDWSGDWHTAISADGHRSVTERRHARRTLGNHRFGELRPEIWIRPANLEPPVLPAGWMIACGPLRRFGDGSSSAEDARAIAERLWPLDTIADTARHLTKQIASAAPVRAPSDGDRFATIPGRFEAAAGVLRFLRSEPLLPPAVVGEEWPVDALRRAYAVFERDLQSDLRDFFART